jgi:hypothetical protein
MTIRGLVRLLEKAAEQRKQAMELTMAGGLGRLFG